ncbi:MAG: tRNA preQ1(34) S-adenosylmethionine ribosyltransferase-isomerase QueA [Alphaproteobacteria bacterium]|nr:tRNA preQ1(34) S-adenosylmethionine ribosyltransferase-isomerase QueA [Alphaproteobacteria bacterium]
MTKDLGLLSSFDFTLPQAAIADHAIEPRDHARLLYVKNKLVLDRHVYDLPDLLRPDDVLVMNDTRVIAARLFGFRDKVKIEMMLNRQESAEPLVWSALAKPAKRLRKGDVISCGADFSAHVLEKGEDGMVFLRFDERPESFFEKLARYGHVPLPPYIKRPCEAQDKERYQTIYARADGAVAAPTAGLHFTPQLLDQLKARGIELHSLTLHVGVGTFLPVKAARIQDHVMHAESGLLDAPTARALNEARAQGRRLVAVGTTVARLLESAADDSGLIHPFCGETSIFITPGYRFRAVDVLLTNFHLPKSTLLMLVSAFAGYSAIQEAYQHAIKQGYRFYSYGDATLLEKDE